ncbi:PREDICTED: uncharacterized protein LOC106102094 [Papilio polytes]|uniref:uncharacterized protein LOC106102094 n=1 Tax=Papilio polytes TaxID=76194 RepID=UPI000676A085|nr:PREDICTED: uncharacterized protein LOC106102094 [Papilio polytes]
MVLCKWLLNLPRNCSKWRPRQMPKKILSDASYTEFINSLPVIIDKGVRETKYLETNELRDRMRRIAEYYIRGRITVHGELTIFAHELLRQSEKIEGDLKNQLNVLAWCTELVCLR